MPTTNPTQMVTTMKRSELIEVFANLRNTTSVDGVNCRAAAVVPSTLNREARSVRTTLTTEDPAMVYDWNTGRIILEVLLVDGAQFEDQTPLLRDHRQYSVDAVLGSITEVSAIRDELDGLLTFGTDLDDAAEGIWRRVDQGHLRRVSVGYDYTRADFITIAAGESGTVNGRKFTAPQDRDLRVVKRWNLREVSVVVIPADKRAQMRAASGDGQQRGTNDLPSQNSNPTDPTDPTPNTRSENSDVNELLDFLRGHGYSGAELDNASLLAWARQQLAAERHADLLAICTRNNITVDATHFPGVRNTPAPPLPPTPPNPGPTPDPVAIERSRQTAIRQMAAEHPVVPATVVARCLDEGLSIDQAREAFLVALRGSTQEPVPGTPPAGHVRGGLTLRALQAGLLMKFGYTPDSNVLRSSQVETVYARRGFEAGWIRGSARQGEQRNEVEAAFDVARNHGLHSGSMMRFAEALVELDGQRAPWNQDELMERAFSHANFNALFGTVVHIMMVAGYQRQPNTYNQIARIIDVPDFRPNQEAMAGGVGRLKKQGKNGEKAALLNIESPMLASVSAERYAGLLKLTDQVFIADSFGVLGVLPEEVGASAASIPNDLLYSIVIGNLNLADNNPLYIAGDNLIADGSLDEDGLTTAGVMLANKTVNGRRIVVNGGLLLHGTTLATKAKKVLNSTTTNGDDNVMRNSYRRLEDNVVDLGCVNPATDPEQNIAGAPNSYFLFSEPLRSLVVAFRQGTNRGPVTRTKRLDEGEWGAAWDVFIDCGAAATSRIGTVRVNQA